MYLQVRLIYSFSKKKNKTTKNSGTDKGKYFVNDVTVSKLKEVKGQVKLQIRKNIQGENVTVSRSMKVSQKSGDKIEFKSQDSTLSFMKNGKKVESISKRIEETNEFVCEAIGVSKAVLNNVIFCHQEDSNWPLDDDKKVKEKFDAIFGTTEYDKAVTKIIDVRKSLLSKQKLAGEIFLYVFIAQKTFLFGAILF